MGDPNQVLDPFNYDEEVADQLPQGLTRKDQIVHIQSLCMVMLTNVCIGSYVTPLCHSCGGLMGAISHWQ